MMPLGLSLLLAATSLSHAKTAPPEMTEFNRECPAPALCEAVDTLYDECKGKPASCGAFVQSFEKLLPEYDCQRPFDVTPTEKYTVPALWLCGARERLLESLSKLKTPEAKKLVASKEFRQALDGAGHLAEQFLPKH